MISTEVGYSQGDVEEPSYEQVCSGSTGHAEVVQVVYDPQQVGAGVFCFEESYWQLVVKGCEVWGTAEAADGGGRCGSFVLVAQRNI